MADGAPCIKTHRQLKSRAAFASESSVQCICVRARRGGRVVFERLHLPLAGRSLHQPAPSLLLSAVQTTNCVASQSSIDQLARAWRPMRELPRKNSVPLFRGGTRYRSAVLCDLANVSMAGGDCVLGFRFVSDHRNVYRF